MVQLLMRIPEGSELGEWTIIELQGDLATKSQAASLEGKFVGDLHFTKQKEPVLVIGHHILYGKEVKLERAILAMKKCHPDLHGNDSMQEDKDQPMEMGDSTQTSSTEYLVKAIVKRKLVFKTRPKPIIANVPKKI